MDDAMSMTEHRMITHLATACEVCDLPTPTDPPPVDWSASFERGRRAWTCDVCLRRNIRNIEGKLDPQWWT
jgi:hypothetical protein